MSQLSSLVRGGLLLMTVATVGACRGEPTRPGASLLAPSRATASASGIPTGRTIVVFRDTAAIPAAGLAAIADLGGLVTTTWDDVGVAFVTGLSAEGLTTLAANELVDAVGNDRILNWLPATRIGAAVAGAPGDLAQGDPAKARYYADGTQWGMRVIKADVAWAAGQQGTPSTRVAIVDTGIDYDHRELRGLVDKVASASFAGLIVGDTATSIEPQVPGDEAYMDNHFHGTHVAATVASNNISVAGVAPHVTLIAVKVLSATGSGSFESVASGIRHASGPAHASVINMSLGAEIDANEEGAPALLEFMRRVIKGAEKQGTIVISAAGNSALNLDVGSTVATPCEQSTVCISATGPLLQQNFDQAATYTNYGITAVHVAAPGGNATENSDGYVTKDLIISACSRRASQAGLAVCRANTDGALYFYAYAAGTSMATPHAVGVAALIRSANPTLSVAGVKAQLLHSADDVQAPGRDVYSNWGRVNAARALGLQ